MNVAMESPHEDDIVRREIDRFSRAVIEPATSRGDHTLDAAAFGSMLDAAEALGFAGSDDDRSGLGAWESLERGGPVMTTLRLLERIATSSPALAFAIHQRALARAVCRAAFGEVPRAARALAIAPHGSYGIGRHALARVLADAPHADEDGILADIYAPGAARLLVVEPGFDALVTPVFRAPGELGFQLHLESALETHARGPSHGMDELALVHARPRCATAFASASRTLFAAVLAAHQLALLALTAGAVERAHVRALAFSRARRQGGAVIDRHPAVALLHAKTRSALEMTRLSLAAVGARALETGSLVRAATLRAELGPQLADGAHAAMQVFGGMGYMQDTGLEKIARDVNALRVMAGSPSELGLFASEWERIHA